MKDYYKVLHISPAATTEEIKKSFRRLALTYHPDKHPDTLLAASKFAEIQEAYSVLKDKAKRSAYNYSRYQQNPHKIYRPLAETPEDVLQLSITLQKRVALFDPYRIDLDLLSFELTDLLSPHNVEVLYSCADPAINKKFVHVVLQCMQLLPFHTATGLVKKCKKIVEIDSSLEKSVTIFLLQKKQGYYWSRYKIYFAVVVAVSFCIILFLSGRK